MEMEVEEGKGVCESKGKSLSQLGRQKFVSRVTQSLGILNQKTRNKMVTEDYTTH